MKKRKILKNLKKNSWHYYPAALLYYYQNEKRGNIMTTVERNNIIKEIAERQKLTHLVIGRKYVTARMNNYPCKWAIASFLCIHGIYNHE